MPDVGAVAVGLLLYVAVFGDVEDVPLGARLARYCSEVSQMAYQRGAIERVRDGGYGRRVLCIIDDDFRCRPANPLAFRCELDGPDFTGPVLEVNGHDLPLFIVPELGCERDTRAIEGAVAGVIRRAERTTNAEARVSYTVRIDLAWTGATNH